MAVRYYDDAIIKKLKKWIPENSNLRVLKPDESKRLFELTADDNADKAFKMPFIALSRDNNIQLLLNTKSNKSFSGFRLNNYQRDENGGLIADNEDQTLQVNAIPIKLNYQLDIYTKKADEGDEYLRNFLFKLINNPVIYIEVPYNDQSFRHIANIRVADTVADTSSISERIFSGQFTRWTIQLEIQDAFLFSIPYKQNWRIAVDENDNIN